MATIRRVVRKIQRPYALALDDQLWPINVLLLVLGAFITGELVVIGSFATGMLWQNAWFLIALNWTVILSGMFAAWKWGGLMARRTQLSLVLALIFFLILLTSFFFFTVFREIVMQDEPSDVVRRPEVTLPEYIQTENPQQQPVQLEHERPVDTEQPEPEPEERLQVTREEPQPQETQQQRPVDQPQPEVQQQPRPTPVQRPQERQTPPRRADDPSRLARQPTPVQSTPTQIASTTANAQSQPRPASQIEAQTQAISQRQADASTQTPTPVTTPQTESEQPTIQTARRQVSSAAQPQQTAARPTLTRQVRQPAELPRVNAVAERSPTQPVRQPTQTPTETAQAVQRRQTDTPPVPRQQPTPVPTPPSTQPTRQVARQAVTPPQPQAVARAADTPQRSTRQAQPTQPSNVAAPTAVQQAPPTPTTAQVSAPSTSVTRRTASTASQQQNPSAQVAQNVAAQSNVQSARQQVSQPATQQPSATTPTASRAVSRATQVAATQAAAVQQSATPSQQMALSRFQPNGSVQRQQAASPAVRQQPTNTQVAETATQPTPNQTRATPAPAQQSIARSSVPSPTRAVQQTAAPTTTSQVATQLAASQFQASSPSLQPQQASVARRSSGSAAAQPARAMTSQADSSVPATSSIASRSRFSTVSNEPSVVPRSDPAQATRRTNAVAQSAASPVAVASPATVQSSEPDASATQPRVAALSRSRRGMAGAGQQRNHDTGEAGPRTVSDIASSSARRSEATAQQPDPSALATSSQARVAKGRAMADTPTATLQAQAVEVAVAAGVDNPSDIDATSSAAQRNASAADTVAAVTADAGSTDFDTGPTQLASEFSSGRAAGGGEPELHHATQSPQASKLAPAGGAELAAINAEAVAPSPVDVPADGGGEPLAPATEEIAANITRSSTTGEQQASPSTTPMEQSADANDVAGGAPQIAADQLQRSTAPAALEGAAVGGGTDEPVRQAATNFTASTRADVPTLETTLAGAGDQRPESIEVAAGPVTRATPNEGAVANPTGQVAMLTDAAGAAAEVQAAGSAAAAAATRATQAGQPDILQAAQASAATRSTSTGAELAAASTQAVAPEAAAEIAAGQPGGGPQSPTADSVAANVTRSRAADAGPATPADPAEAGTETGQAAQVAAASAQTGSARAQQSAAADVGAPTVSNALAAVTGPVRAESGASFATDTQVRAPSVTGSSPEAGEPVQIEVASAELSRDDGQQGIKGIPSSQPTGAAAGEVALNVPNLGPSGARPGIRPQADDGGQPGPAVASSTGGAPLKVARAAAIPGLTKVVIDDEQIGGGTVQVAQREAPMQIGAGEGALQRRETGGTQALVRAELGAGGLGVEAAPEAGSNSRKAQMHSEVLALATDARFQERDIGGPQFSGNTVARDTGAAFEGRKQRFGLDGELGSTPNVGPEIVSGLEFLRRHQSDDGSWSFNNFGRGLPEYENERANIRSDAAATGLALMCFLGAGYDHFDFGGEYTNEVQAALVWLIDHQRGDGNLYVDQDPESSKSATLYSHAIATMALCEAYGMTRDPKIKDAAQKAIGYIEASQHAERGGWRYVPGESSDLSVTGWMIAALKSGDLAGLEVKKATYQSAFDYLQQTVYPGSGGARYVYNPNAPDSQAHGRDVSPAMTAVGLLMRLYEGWDRKRDEIQRGADYLSDTLPDNTTQGRDTYYWYYATQVMFHMRGDYWEGWQRRLHEVLRATQEQTGRMAGSWNPRGAVPDRWGAHGGRLYVTAMNLLSLEVQYRYLPLYQETDK